MDLLRIVRQALEDLEPVAELGDDDTHALMFEARIGHQKIQALDVLRFDAEGRIREFRIFIRPLPGLTPWPPPWRRRWQRVAGAASRRWWAHRRGCRRSSPASATASPCGCCGELQPRRLTSSTAAHNP